MFGRDAVTNLSQLTKPKLRYMGTEDLILDHQSSNTGSSIPTIQIRILDIRGYQ